MAKVIAINISEQKKTPKKTIEEGTLIENFGFENDAHAGKWHRQVSLLAKESIEKAKGMRTDGLCHGMFAENITTEGIVLYTLPVGTKLKIGTAICEVTQIGKECHADCAIRKAAGDCVMPREGIFVKVLEAGKAKAGDMVVKL